MSIWQIILLALLQGITEFLPISSSAHLILVPAWLGWQDQGIAFDVAVHFGSLIAVIAFSRREIAAILREWRAWAARGAPAGPSARLGLMIAVASLPVAALGLLLHDTVSSSFREPQLIAVAGALFAILMLWSDRRPQSITRIREIGFRQALWIGCGQALALIPGASRSGVTMTAARILGMARPAAARLSFLLAIPVITAAGALEALNLAAAPAAAHWGALALGMAVAGLAAFGCMGLLLRLVARWGLWPFAAYRLALSAVILL
ncbi:MAG: undecaprenyl-diphosphate phosphatase [Gammaproteobacteria bacterium]|nr:undecaprenyl-diphosphate phosphatase [Gammaproteobacteria bacterium]MCY4341605.1 undecaprenyl-diphosphate phosphatase [Gammaproteobacteria bacterium]